MKIQKCNFQFVMCDVEIAQYKMCQNGISRSDRWEGHKVLIYTMQCFEVHVNYAGGHDNPGRVCGGCCCWGGFDFGLVMILTMMLTMMIGMVIGIN